MGRFEFLGRAPTFLQIFRAALYRGVAEIRGRFEQGMKGEEVIQANAFLVDQLVRCIYDFADTHVYPDAVGRDRMAVAATGGYGRGELAPFSDIDLMFLLPGQKTARLEQLIEYVLYMLWDSGLQVGHALDRRLRSAGEGRSFIRTSLLEALAMGRRGLFCAFGSSAARSWPAGAAFVEQKLAERDARHERMGDSRYVLNRTSRKGRAGFATCRRCSGSPSTSTRSKRSANWWRGVFTEADVQQFGAPRTFSGRFVATCTTSPAGPKNAWRSTTGAHRQPAGLQRSVLGPRRRALHEALLPRHQDGGRADAGALRRARGSAQEDEAALPHAIAVATILLPPPARRPENRRRPADRRRPRAFSRDPVLLLRLFHEAQRQGIDIHPQALRLAPQNLRLVDANYATRKPTVCSLKY